MELFEVVFVIGDEGGEDKGGKAANSGFIRHVRGILVQYEPAIWIVCLEQIEKWNRKPEGRPWIWGCRRCGVAKRMRSHVKIVNRALEAFAVWGCVLEVDATEMWCNSRVGCSCPCCWSLGEAVGCDNDTGVAEGGDSRSRSS